MQGFTYQYCFSRERDGFSPLCLRRSGCTVELPKGAKYCTMRFSFEFLCELASFSHSSGHCQRVASEGTLLAQKSSKRVLELCSD